MNIDLSKIRQAFMGRKEKAHYFNVAVSFLVAYLVSNGHLTLEAGGMIIGSGALTGVMSIWGTAHEDAAEKGNGNGGAPK